MVTAKFDYLKEEGTLVMRVSGHAGAGPKGFDLVCAGVSSIAVGIAQVISDMGFEGKFRKKPNITIREGFVKVVVKPKDQFFAETLHCLFVGEVQLGLMAQVHSQFVKLIPFDASIADVSK